MKNNHLMILLCCLLASCSVTKNLPEGEKLYVGIDRMEVLNEDKTEAGITALTEVEASLAYPPNNAVFGSSSLRWPVSEVTQAMWLAGFRPALMRASLTKLSLVRVSRVVPDLETRTNRV